MRNQIKRLTVTMLSLSVILMCLPLNASAMTFQEAYEQYREDEQFQMQSHNSPEKAREMLQNIVKESYQISGFAVNPSDATAYCNVTLTRQTEGENCGFATMLQTLYGMGKQSVVPGSTDAQKMKNLELEMKARPDYPAGGTTAIVYMIAEMLNAKTNSSYKYAVGTSMTREVFHSRVYNSLTGNHPVILHARTRSLGYYNGNNYSHYLSLDQMPAGSGNCRIADCHYSNDYFGYHSVTQEEAYLCITEEAARYLIYN